MKSKQFLEFISSQFIANAVGVLISAPLSFLMQFSEAQLPLVLNLLLVTVFSA